MARRPIERLGTLALPPILLSAPLPAFAQDGRLDVAESGDSGWLLAAALIALIAPIGVAASYAGRVRPRNRMSTAMQAAAVIAAVSLAWIVVGYTLAFGEGDGAWIGNGNAWMLVALGNVRAGTNVPESVFAMFQMAFALMAATLLTGAWTERGRFGWAVVLCTLWSVVVYAPIAHWTWGGGWLARSVGMLDWSGGITVHLSAGISAAVAALMIGRRKGTIASAAEQHAPALPVAGAACMWIGSLALSGGAAFAANDDASSAIIVTYVAAAAAALTWITAEWIATRRVTPACFALGSTAGIASIAAGAGFVSPSAAIVIGITGSLMCRGVTAIMRSGRFVDDPMAVFAVHGVGGLIGSLWLGVFLSPTLGGTGYAADMNMVAQVVAQAVGVLVIAAWSAVGTIILALMASVVFPMRASEETEISGLDSAYH